MKQRFVDAVRDERAALLASLDGIHQARLSSQPVCGTWTAKDVLAHLAAVDGAALHAINQARRGEAVTWPWESYADGNIWNEAVVNARRDRSVADVRAELEATGRTLLAELTRWPDDGGPFGPGSWDEEKSPIGWLPSHDREHAVVFAALASEAASAR